MVRRILSLVVLGALIAAGCSDGGDDDASNAWLDIAEVTPIGPEPTLTILDFGRLLELHEVSVEDYQADPIEVVITLLSDLREDGSRVGRSTQLGPDLFAGFGGPADGLSPGVIDVLATIPEGYVYRLFPEYADAGSVPPVQGRSRFGSVGDVLLQSPSADLVDRTIAGEIPVLADDPSVRRILERLAGFGVHELHLQDRGLVPADGPTLPDGVEPQFRPFETFDWVGTGIRWDGDAYVWVIVIDNPDDQTAARNADILRQIIEEDGYANNPDLRWSDDYAIREIDTDGTLTIGQLEIVRGSTVVAGTWWTFGELLYMEPAG